MLLFFYGFFQVKAFSTSFIELGWHGFCFFFSKHYSFSLLSQGFSSFFSSKNSASVLLSQGFFHFLASKNSSSTGPSKSRLLQTHFYGIFFFASMARVIFLTSQARILLSQGFLFFFSFIILLSQGFFQAF